MQEFYLKELLKIKNGKDHKVLSEGDIPVFGSGGIMRFGNKYLYDKESILLPRKGSLENIQFSNIPFWTVDTLYYTEINVDLTEPYYLYYFLKSLNLERLNSGTGVPSMTFDAYYNVKIKLPSLANQKVLAGVLRSIDSKIELNNKLNDNLEQMAKTLYDYWFVQFDFPDANGKPYKTGGGKMVWNDELKREVPSGWEVKKIKDFAKTGSGGTPLSTKHEYYKDGNIPWINSGEVNSSFIIESKNYITEAGLNNSSAKIFPKGTILMAMYGATAGQVSLMDIEACTNQAICAIMPNDRRISPYLKFGLHQIYQHLINLSSGSARDNLSQDKIKELFFAIPEDRILHSYFEIGNQCFKMILTNIKENQKLAELREWLLPMLMNGQVKIG